ncbi:MAG: lipocalin-like domain-containing protein [Gemmatimonadetes bacterium]|nr:lipocalin-like domain-containing protein [Gemmatimonadota bacterium]
MNVPQASAEAARATLAGLFAYFGRYTIDTVTRRVSHQVEGAFLQDWVGATLIREYRFISDNLVELRVVHDEAGRTPANPTVLVWERVGR